MIDRMMYFYSKVQVTWQSALPNCARVRHCVTLLCGLAVVAGCVAAAQSAPVKPEPSPADRLTGREHRAYELLERTRQQVPGATYNLRCYLKLELAKGYLRFNRRRSHSLLKQAFSDTPGILDTNEKVQLQSEILMALLPFGRDEVERLLPDAELLAREEPLRNLLEHYSAEKKYEKAVQVLENQASTFDEFPYDLAGPLMLHLPESKSAEKGSLFSLALWSYRQHTHNQLAVGGEDFPKLVARFWRRLPPSLVLQAANEILAQALSARAGRFELSSGKGFAAFSSVYQYRLFELLPIYRTFDPHSAERLLAENEALQEVSQKFPDGLTSLDPTVRETALREGESSELNESVIVGHGEQADNTARTGPAIQTTVHTLVTDSQKDGFASLSKALDLPVQIGSFFPRPDALVGIAAANWTSVPALASSAFAELNKAIEQCPPLFQAKYLVAESKILILMNDRKALSENLKKTVKVAETLYKEDSDAEDPNRATKAYWPSAHIWKEAISIAMDISEGEAETVAMDIRDPEMRMIQTASLANLYLGIPDSSHLVMVKKHRNESVDMFGSGGQ